MSDNDVNNARKRFSGKMLENILLRLHRSSFSNPSFRHWQDKKLAICGPYAPLALNCPVQQSTSVKAIDKGVNLPTKICFGSNCACVVANGK